MRSNHFVHKHGMFVPRFQSRFFTDSRPFSALDDFFYYQNECRINELENEWVSEWTEEAFSLEFCVIRQKKQHGPLLSPFNSTTGTSSAIYHLHLWFVLDQRPRWGEGWCRKRLSRMIIPMLYHTGWRSCQPWGREFNVGKKSAYHPVVSFEFDDLMIDRSELSLWLARDKDFITQNGKWKSAKIALRRIEILRSGVDLFLSVPNVKSRDDDLLQLACEVKRNYFVCFNVWFGLWRCPNRSGTTRRCTFRPPVPLQVEFNKKKTPNSCTTFFG